MARRSAARLARGPLRSIRRWPSRSRSPRRSRPPTRPASSTAISSPRTSCSRDRARSCSTSAWRVCGIRCVGAPPRDAGDDPPTRQSALLGTLPYMAPEQLRGAEVDTRTDLFAFGAVLYEMLTGSRAFDAASEAELAAAILEHEPAPLAPRVPQSPPALDAARRHLPRQGSGRTVADGEGSAARAALGAGQSGTARPRRPPGASRAGVCGRSRRGASIGLLGFAAISVSRQPPPARRISFSIYPPEGTKFPRGTAEMAVSPDGSRLVFVAISADGNSRLWLRRFDAVESRAIDGSEDARRPVLVARRTLDWVLRPQQAEANRRGRRPAAGHLRSRFR